MQALVVEQLLNGLQLGVLLFLLASGLTLVFGIMDLMNLAHGSFYMVGAFLTATVALATGSFALGVLAAVAGTFALGVLVEVSVLRFLYPRGHLDQLLATFGLLLVLNELTRIVWGPAGLEVPLPAALGEHITLFGLRYPVYRCLVIGAGLAVAAGLYLLIARTRLGMLIRAGASNRAMIDALGVNIRRLYTVVFGIGAALAGLAGALAGPITSVNVGMGEDVLILTFVVIVIGGIGSIRGAFVAALLVGVIDTMGRAFLDTLLVLVMSVELAETAAPAIASMLIYLLMAVVLFLRPQGLFPARTG